MAEGDVGRVSETQPQAIERREGVTAAERYLKRLAERSFLSLWSYAGVFRNQGRPNGGGDGKELADLLVVFDRHIIIFSDKDCKFRDSGNLELDWRRWFHRAVQHSADQVWGAERWITKFPGRLYLDRGCTRRFPIPLPDPSAAKFHRIVVAHGISAPCRERMGGTGSLMIWPDVIGAMHTASQADGGTAFVIGQLDPARGFVHVLDDTSLDVLLSTLDTVTDLVNYLSRKERFIESGRLLFAAGEDDLLAWCLGHTNADREHDFIMPDGMDVVGIDEGLWARFVNSRERQAQIEADKISYAWDGLIETLAKHILAGTQYYATKGGVEHGERIMRFLAGERRLRRRMLARTLGDMIQTTPDGVRRTVVVPPSRAGDPHYVFLLLPHHAGIPEDDYREVRRHFLGDCCMVAKLEYPDAQDIVGIATETGREPQALRSEDAAYFDASSWTANDEAEARRLQRELGLLTNVTKYAIVEREYPTPPGQSPVTAYKPPTTQMKGKARNRPCPCGSGRKFKKCCGG